MNKTHLWRLENLLCADAEIQCKLGNDKAALQRLRYAYMVREHLLYGRHTADDMKRIKEFAVAWCMG